jgi:hypothetical protein
MASQQPPDAPSSTARASRSARINPGRTWLASAGTTTASRLISNTLIALTSVCRLSTIDSAVGVEMARRPGKSDARAASGGAHGILKVARAG